MFPTQVLFLCLAFTTCQGCEDGWLSFEDHCYILTPYPIELMGGIIEARKECLLLGADLATIKTEAEQETVQTIFDQVNRPEEGHGAKNVYIGLSDNLAPPSANASFRWFDGTELDYTNWFRGFVKPREGGRCVTMSSGYKYKKNELTKDQGQWAAVTCLASTLGINYSLCEKKNTPRSKQTEGHFFEILQSSYMMDFEVSQENVNDYIECLNHCSASTTCLSVNYNPAGLEFHNCVLNNVTRWEAGLSRLAIEPSWDYYEMAHPGF